MGFTYVLVVIFPFGSRVMVRSRKLTCLEGSSTSHSSCPKLMASLMCFFRFSFHGGGARMPCPRLERNHQ